MAIVEEMKPMRPEVRLDIIMLVIEITETFPKRRVHRRRLPFFLTGIILWVAAFMGNKNKNSPYVLNNLLHAPPFLLT